MASRTVEDLLLNSPSLARFAEGIAKERCVLIEELWDAPKSYLLSLLVRVTGKNVLVLTSGKGEDLLASNLDYFDIRSFYEFPAWETLPGEEIPPSPDIVGKRFEILYQFLTNQRGKIVLASLQACLQKLPSKTTLRPNCNLWRVGDEIPFDALHPFLEALGYRKESVVADKGQYALRMGILDIFPLSSTDPYRVECFGDMITSIRTFDPIGQVSIQKMEEIFICPGSEHRLLEEEKELSTLLDYLGNETIVIFDDLLALEDRYVSLKGLPGSRSRFFCSIEEFLSKTETLTRIFWTDRPIEELSAELKGERVGRSAYNGKLTFQPTEFDFLDKRQKGSRWFHPFHVIADFFSPLEERSASSKEEILLGIDRYSTSPLHLHLLSMTDSEEENFKRQIAEVAIRLPANTLFEKGYLSSGFSIPESHLAILPMTELTKRFKIRRQRWRGSYHTPASAFHDLKSGDLVVHFHSGIGKYLGVDKRPNHLGKEEEFLIIEYAASSKLFVPMASSHLVSRYIGSHEELPSLSQLGTQKWQRARIEAQKAIVGYAEELLRLSAAREVLGGYRYPADGEKTLQFEEDFPFVETDDQLRAIDAIKQDMTSDKAMDRLICGDVGYGKTEVAMRAAFKAVVDGKKQVALLVPTTVLAMQHYETFCERMANYEIRVGVVSRFVSPKKIKETLKKAEEGEIDILVGTHRIISKDVSFKRLGLIIIDEEQRFGVKAKEHLKQLKLGVDCLVLSATPIPRTLYMSLIGARDISVISTPPQDRLPIKSHIAEREPSTIQNALLRELSRDGQAYFIHNRVETIDQVAEELQQLVPAARIVVGHGQMSPDELDNIYHLFKQGNADILVATTIVENGVDIPNANTILIDRADQFGLADLYQLRGRVGRSSRPAYAYFLVPVRREIHEIAHKRLLALIEASGYGGGMKAAMRDLELRGAGDILGIKQSGQISSIGFHLYCKLLRRTVEALKKKKSIHFTETKLEFTFDANLPEEYIAEPSLRREFYHRLGEAIAEESVDALFAEMEDRLGPAPKEVVWLCLLIRLKIFAAERNYSLLKFERFTLTTEKIGKETSRHTHPMPKVSDPKEFETAVRGLLL